MNCSFDFGGNVDDLRGHGDISVSLTRLTNGRWVSPGLSIGSLFFESVLSSVHQQNVTRPLNGRCIRPFAMQLVYPRLNFRVGLRKRPSSYTSVAPKHTLYRLQEFSIDTSDCTRIFKEISRKHYLWYGATEHSDLPVKHRSEPCLHSDNLSWRNYVKRIQ
mgnify:CR=1 FL=1